MAAEGFTRGKDPRARDERGQSLIELMIMMPLLVGFIVLLLRTDMAIQTSIVNQQYARAQALYLAQNSPTYPGVAFRAKMQETGLNMMTIGVSDKASPLDEEGNSTNKLDPEATVHAIHRNRAPEGSNEAKSEPENRGNVRVRTTVALCTPSFVLSTGGAYRPVLEVNGAGQPLSGYRETLGEKTQYDFCKNNYQQ